MTNANVTTDPTFLTDETLHEAYELEIADKNGAPVRFGELVAGKGDSVTTIVIFVRHFFCMYDQDYVRALSSKITQRLLDTIPHHAKPAQVIIIGCGDHTLIGPYMEETSDVLPIYSDPSAKIYETLQMKRTFKGFTDPPPYACESFPSALFKDLKQRWKRGWGGQKSGPADQQGGEWIFQRGRLKYAHRMQAVNDHLTADQLLDILKLGQVQDQGEQVDQTGVESSPSQGNST
ncbi:hypothetical protein N7448_005425 [Penicillium atrosanguineum]|uniref:Uncharacterized protein n=1 Tax=Penicillium atrosanguineum TaxID=1132637 RepID=A0A9W9H3C3_9EURO|nr:uncharacterized protein N7443_009155 [Penicillium atrosanguineum]KAJ5126115.1 hypothetical protein N7526_008292 [Penicillium atrosanguineum]KAJ5136871.1 hypothetical protein N7448_005425 [Penicillium atrosanguineum]KAJ5293202.1 hypothetical protein N7443_009155 [Penicillium atrosanguineum]KAJ5302762.1 hypothetical protein N7476_009561 [Penicillium atrosanguineum]